MARPKRKVTDDELVAMVTGEVSQVSTDSFALISDQRINSNYSFANQWTAYTTPTTNMSKVNFYFTPSVVNTLTMHQSKIFCSDKKTVEFIPAYKDPEFQVGAEQMSRMVNTVLHRENPGFEIITEMFRSAAVNKNAVAKVSWTEDKEIQEIEYTDIDPVLLDEIIANHEENGWEVKVKKEKLVTESVVEQQVDELTGEVVEIEAEGESGSYTLRLERDANKISIDVIPPEEFLINEDTTSINNDKMTRFVGQRKEMYRTDVKVMFPKIDVDELSDQTELDGDFEKLARHSFDGTDNSLYEGAGTQNDTGKVTVVESWIRADRDGDGFAEWRHVFTCGQMLLMDEEWFGPLPFTSYTFFPVPHKFYGLSVYDRLKGYEELATGLMRAEADAARLGNTFRLFAKEGTVDRRALQSGKPGVIPVSNTFEPNDVMVVPGPTGGGASNAIIQELRQQVIADIGIDPVNGQVSADIEKSGNDAEKTQMAMDNASVKVEGYSRRFAEGALRDIAWQIAYLLVKHKDDPFVQNVVQGVSPDQPFIIGELGLTTVMSKTDLISKVGLGHQSGSQKIAAVGQIQQMLTAFEQNPTMAGYNLIKEAMMGWGYEQPEQIIGPLEMWKEKAGEQKAMLQSQQQMQQQQLQIQQQEVQHRMQIETQRFEFEKQIGMMKAESEIARNMAQAGLSDAKAEGETADIAREDRRMAIEEEAVGSGEAEVRVSV